MRCLVAVFVLVAAGCGSKSSGGEDETSTGVSTGEASTGQGTGIVGTSGGGSTSTDPTTGGVEGTCPGDHNHLEGDKCFCDEGFVWCDPFDDSDLDCCEGGAEGTSPTNPTTTPSGTSGEATDVGTTEVVDETGGSSSGEPLACDSPPPAGCDPASESVYCQQGPGCTLAGSQIFWCGDAGWTMDAGATTKACEAKGEQFAFGCRVEGEAVIVECGHGPGTACSDNVMDQCIDETTLEGCKLGKVAQIDCVQACKSGEIDGQMHTAGYCMVSRISAECACCDGADCP